MYLNIKISPELTLMEYFPSKSVSVPIVEPLTTTLTPGKGPDPSDTFPDIVLCCANQICTPNRQKQR